MPCLQAELHWLFMLTDMQMEEDGEEGISDAVHAQMQAKWKELSKKRYGWLSFFAIDGMEKSSISL